MATHAPDKTLVSEMAHLYLDACYATPVQLELAANAAD
jgi:hypothetical protein